MFVAGLVPLVGRWNIFIHSDDPPYMFIARRNAGVADGQPMDPAAAAATQTPATEYACRGFAIQTYRAYDRFESIVAVTILAGLAVLHSSAFGQFVIIGDDDKAKAVNPSTKVGKGKPQTGKSRPTQPAEPPKPEEPTFTVAGGFETTKEKAKETAIRDAVERLHVYLLDQHPQAVPDHRNGEENANQASGGLRGGCRVWQSDDGANP